MVLGPTSASNNLRGNNCDFYQEVTPCTPLLINAFLEASCGVFVGVFAKSGNPLIRFSSLRAKDFEF